MTNGRTPAFKHSCGCVRAVSKNDWEFLQREQPQK